MTTHHPSWRLLTAFILILPVALLPSCARDQQLTQIQIQPNGGITFGAADPTLSANFRAYGTYIHPPQTKDITNQVSWVSSIPLLAAVTSEGVVSPTGKGCGVGTLFAQMHQDGNDVVSNTVPVTINGPTADGCIPSGGTTLTVSFTGNTGLGQITSSPAGISCTGPSPCSASFTPGTTVTLTEAPIGAATFGGWSNNCTAISATMCTVVVNTSITVTATFN